MSPEKARELIETWGVPDGIKVTVNKHEKPNFNELDVAVYWKVGKVILAKGFITDALGESLRYSWNYEEDKKAFKENLERCEKYQEINLAREWFGLIECISRTLHQWSVDNPHRPH